MVRLDLAEGTAENLPEDIRFLKAEKLRGGWIVSFLAPLKEEDRMYSLFSSTFRDEAGQEYSFSWESSSHGYEDPATGERTDSGAVFTSQFPLPGLDGDVAYLEPLFNRVSTFAIPVAVPIR